jgi:pimeloyl-ACP methyl ester carboxylesterase
VLRFGANLALQREHVRKLVGFLKPLSNRCLNFIAVLDVNDVIHRYAENSDSWAPLAADLMKDHTVVVPDLRGIGKSSKPESGYDKKTQAKDIRAVVTALGYDKTFVVAHDIGNMMAYAYAAMHPDKVERLVVMDAPIPGIEPWKEILPNPGVWHFNFHGPDAERLVAGRERIYFDRIWNDFTGDLSKPDEATRNFFAATYAQPGGMRAGFAQFTAFSQDAKDNEALECPLTLMSAAQRDS